MALGSRRQARPGPREERGEPDAHVLIVSLGSTEGLREADRQLHESLLRAGAHATLVAARAPAPKRTLMATDLAWARAARAAAQRALAAVPRDRPPRLATIYSSTTAALLWPRAGAVRFDAPAAANRPGRHGYWQRPLERRRLAQAPLLLPWSSGALEELPPRSRDHTRALVLPVPVALDDGAGRRAGRPLVERDIAAVTYAANPSKKGLDRVIGAWRELRSGAGAGAGAGAAAGESPELGELVIAGAQARELERAGLREGEQGVRVVGALEGERYRALLARARVFVCAPRREDYGIAQLEALAHGCMLVSTPAPGPYAALPIARALDPRFVNEDLPGALRAALSEPESAAASYAERARAALAPFTREAVDAIVARELLPRLLAQAR